MPFSKASSGFISDEITVVEMGLRVLEGASEKNLPGRRFQKVRTTNDFTNLHLGIIDHYRKLICRNIVSPKNDEVSEVFSNHE